MMMTMLHFIEFFSFPFCRDDDILCVNCKRYAMNMNSRNSIRCMFEFEFEICLHKISSSNSLGLCYFMTYRYIEIKGIWHNNITHSPVSSSFLPFSFPLECQSHQVKSSENVEKERASLNSIRYFMCLLSVKRQNEAKDDNDGRGKKGFNPFNTYIQ